MKDIYPEIISTHTLIGNDIFVFKYPVTCKQILHKLSLFLLKLM